MTPPLVDLGRLLVEHGNYWSGATALVVQLGLTGRQLQVASLIPRFVVAPTARKAAERSAVWVDHGACLAVR